MDIRAYKPFPILKTKLFILLHSLLKKPFLKFNKFLKSKFLFYNILFMKQPRDFLLLTGCGAHYVLKIRNIFFVQKLLILQTSRSCHLPKG